MLKSLLIKNFILFNEIEIDFTSGFNVLCGETGAGKSIIIKALDCALGAKVTKEMILDKSKPAYIEAVFDKNSVETIVSREISSSSKFRINGMLTNSPEIKELRESLVDIHSQHQTYSYISQKTHINLLDEYIIKKAPEFYDLKKTYKETYLKYLEIEKKINFLKENCQNNEREIEFLRFQLKELDEASVKENEEEDLKKEIDVLSNIQELKEGAYSSFWALYGDGQSIIEALGKIKYTISSLSNLDNSLNEVSISLEDIYENLKENACFLRDYSTNLEINPQKLEELNERLSLIQKLKRKYGTELDKVRDETDKKLNELLSSENNLDELEENLTSLDENLKTMEEKLSEYRNVFGFELAKLIEEKLKTLELKEARFEISQTRFKRQETGVDNIEFLISTNKNQNPMALSKVASGGEISRMMIALKTIFAKSDKISTVVFDEIDTGISGVTSTSVKNSLFELSKDVQIICITHQPIICAGADNFIWVVKTHDDNTNVKIEILNDQRRLEALAQLAGGEINEKTIEFAKTLIK